MTQVTEAVLVKHNSESLISPELLEINALYREALAELEFQKQQIEQQIQAIKGEGETLHDCWLEDYTKQKNGHSYRYTQLRWVSGAAGGKSKVRGKAVPKKQVAEVRSQIERGKRIEALGRQTEEVQDKIDQLKQAVLLFHNDLRRFITRTIRH